MQKINYELEISYLIRRIPLYDSNLTSWDSQPSWEWRSGRN